MKMSTARDSTNGGGWGVGLVWCWQFVDIHSALPFAKQIPAGSACACLACLASFVLSVPSRRDEQGADLACSRWSDTWTPPADPLGNQTSQSRGPRLERCHFQPLTPNGVSTQMAGNQPQPPATCVPMAAKASRVRFECAFSLPGPG